MILWDAFIFLANTDWNVFFFYLACPRIVCENDFEDRRLPRKSYVCYVVETRAAV